LIVCGKIAGTQGGIVDLPGDRGLQSDLVGAFALQGDDFQPGLRVVPGQFFQGEDGGGRIKALVVKQIEGFKSPGQEARIEILPAVDIQGFNNGGDKIGKITLLKDLTAVVGFAPGVGIGSGRQAQIDEITFNIVKSGKRLGQGADEDTGPDNGPIQG
jgi:hypothetical protein